MSNPVKTVINRFDGAITNNPRNNRENTARTVSNFDPLTNPFKLTPYREAEDGDSAGDTNKLRNFTVARRTGTTYSLYGLGVQGGANDGKVWYKDLTTGASNDLDDNGWTAAVNGEQGTGTVVNFDTFTYYQNQDEIYYIRDSQYISAFSPTGSAIVDSEADLTSVTNHAEGLVHSKDDICYIPYDNKIASKDGAAAFTTAALTLPASVYIPSICEYGNYLGISGSPLSGLGRSRAYLWNRDSSLETLSETVDFGAGELKILEAIHGELIGISLLGGQSSRTKDKIVFRRYTGGYPTAQEIMTIVAEDNSTILLNKKQVEDDRIYFMASIRLNGNTLKGVWSFGKSKTDVGYTLIHERTLNNDDDGSNFTLRNFALVGEYLFQAFVDDGTHVISKTTDTQTAFSAKSIYESVINPKIDRDLNHRTKRIRGVFCGYEPLPSAGQVDMYYRVDGGAWQQIFSETTDGEVCSSTTKDINGDNFASGREYEFKIESTGGAEITEWGADYDIQEDLV
jgi:hypothetical protein